MKNDNVSTNCVSDLGGSDGGCHLSRSSGSWLPTLAGSEQVIWRILLLVGALFFIKLIMLMEFRQHLYEAYWRVGRLRALTDWVNLTGFFVFALVVGMNLWMLAKRQEKSEIRSVRRMNALLLILGGIFVVLRFHEGESNNLQPVMWGILNWGDLVSYYNLNLFFRPPFLAMWMAAYAVAYWWLVRRGRESHVLRLTAIFATAYMFLCLRELQEHREELISLSAIGIAALLCTRRHESRLSALWLLLPIGCIAGVYISWMGFSPALADPHPMGVVLAGWTLVLFVGGSFLARRWGLQNGWSWLVTFIGLSFLVLVNAHYPIAVNYRSLACIALTVPRYFLGEFAVAAFLLGVALYYRRWRPAGSLLWLDAAVLGLIAVGLADLRIAQVMGSRFDWDVFSLALGEGPTMMWRMAAPHLPLVTILLAAIISMYALALRFARKRSRRVGGSPVVQRFNLEYALVLFVLLGLAGRLIFGPDKVAGQTVEVFLRSSPFARGAASPVMDYQEFTESATMLGIHEVLSAPPPSEAEPAVRDLNVVFILLESTFNEHLSMFNGKHETQPMLSQYRDRMELFPNFYSSFGGSINARFACFSGLYPVRDYKQFTLQRVAVKSIFEVLHDHGYSNSIFYSSHFDYTNFRDFLRGRDVAEMFDADTMPGERKTSPLSWGLREEETLAAMQERIRNYAEKGQKFFMTYIPACPHHPYDGTPERFQKFHPKEFKNVTEFYLNDLLYMDWIVTSVIDELKSAGLLDKTLVVITGDHGEMLGAGGGPIGHGWALTPELANVPLIIMDPASPGAAVNETVGSQVDLLPTILDRLGVPIPADQLYQGVSLYSPMAQSERVIYLNTFSQYAIIRGRAITFGDRKLERRNAVSFASFSIENEGSRSAYMEQISEAAPSPISVFDEFQENFLRNYPRYCQMIRPEKTEMTSLSNRP